MPESQSVKYLIIGGGVASAQGAVGIRELDADGSVMIVCGEPRLPYDRPPLSKSLLLGKTTPEDAESKDPSFYTDKNVEVRTGVRATEVDLRARSVKLGDGSTVAYEKLLLATGATPNKPKIAGLDKPGVHLLRTVDDSLAIREAMESAKSVVLVGTGYIGMEVGAAAIGKGLKATFVDPTDHPWGRFASPATGNFLRHDFEKRGAKFHMGESVESVEGEGRATGVKTKGGQTLAADMVVVGVGVSLNTDLAKQAGLDMDPEHGVVADESLRTSDPNVYVAGDIAAFQDSSIGRRWHAEHYLNARWQGNQAGRNMAGAGEKLDKVPYFFSDMLDLHMILRGDPQGGKEAKMVGDLEAGEFVELYAREDGTLAMGLAFSHTESRLDPWSDKLEALVRERANVADLDETTFGLDADAGLG